MFVNFIDGRCSPARRSVSLLILAALILGCLGKEEIKEEFIPDESFESVKYPIASLIAEKFEEDGFIRYFALFQHNWRCIHHKAWLCFASKEIHVVMILHTTISTKVHTDTDRCPTATSSTTSSCKPRHRCAHQTPSTTNSSQRSHFHHRRRHPTRFWLHQFLPPAATSCRLLPPSTLHPL